MTTFIKQYEQTFPVLTTINLPVTKASGAAPTIEFNAEDRAAAKEEEVKQRTSPSQRGNQ